MVGNSELKVLYIKTGPGSREPVLPATRSPTSGRFSSLLIPISSFYPEFGETASFFLLPSASFCSSMCLRSANPPPPPHTRRVHHASSVNGVSLTLLHCCFPVVFFSLFKDISFLLSGAMHRSFASLASVPLQ